jgi:predicted transcriptional regulator
MNIILSIHPKWAKLIYEGKKTVEWRKTTPKKADSQSVIFLYETAPVCKVTGWVRFNGANAVDAAMAGSKFKGQAVGICKKCCLGCAVYSIANPGMCGSDRRDKND